MSRIGWRVSVASGVIAAVAVAGGGVAATPQRPPSPQAPGPGAGLFYNYDVTSQSCVPSVVSTCTNIDWPVTLIFRGPKTTVSSVRSMLQNAGYSFNGSTEYDYVAPQGGTFQWASDGGKKRFFSAPIAPLIGAPSIGWFSYVHVRLYAPTGGYFAGSGVHYVVATTHYDLNELFSATYGWSEVAERQVAADLVAKRQVAASAVAADAVAVGNAEGTNLASHPAPASITPRKDGTHFWQSDGNATLISVP
jgi:hypothetical protein